MKCYDLARSVNECSNDGFEVRIFVQESICSTCSSQPKHGGLEDLNMEVWKMFFSFKRGDVYGFQPLAVCFIVCQNSKSSMFCVCFPPQAIGHMLMSLVFCNKRKTICSQGSEECGWADHTRNGKEGK